MISLADISGQRVQRTLWGGDARRELGHINAPFVKAIGTNCQALNRWIAASLVARE